MCGPLIQALTSRLQGHGIASMTPALACMNNEPRELVVEGGGYEVLVSSGFQIKGG